MGGIEEKMKAMKVASTEEIVGAIGLDRWHLPRAATDSPEGKS